MSSQVNEIPRSTKHALCISGTRLINRRMALFVESLWKSGSAVSILALPRHAWSLNRTEETLPFAQPSRCRTTVGNVSVPVDQIFCFHWTVLPIAVLLGIRHRAPVVYDEHDFYEMNSLEGSGSSLRVRMTSKAVRLIHRLFVPHVTLVTCIHQYNEELRRHLLQWNSNVLELHNYPPAVWNSNGRQIPATAAHICFVYIGGVFAEKGVRAAAEAFLSLPVELRSSAEFHVFGTGDETLLKWLEAQPQIVLHRQISPARFRDFAATHNCVGMSLLADTPRYNLVGTNSTKLYEYMAMGIPVIATASGEIPEQIHKWKSGLVVSTQMQVSEIAAAMCSLLTQPERIAEASRRAFETMQQEHMTWEAEWKKLSTTLLTLQPAAPPAAS
jgi:glycosyltransferase involved in cell wall biosynthesis